MGEFARQPTKELTDEQVVAIIRKLVKSEKESSASGAESDNDYLAILEAYLPQMASSEDIQAWIKTNIDFSQFKNKMQAMKPIMAHFGSTADGNLVKQILQEMA